MLKRYGFFWAVLFSFLAGVGAVPPAGAEDENPMAEKIAEVNGKVINGLEFAREMKRLQTRMVMEGQSISRDRMPAIQAEALEGLIHRELLYQEALRNEIKVDEAVLNEAWEKMKAPYGNEEQFKKALAQARFSEEEARQELRRGLAIQEFLDARFVAKAVVTEEEIQAYYKGREDEFRQPEQVRASHILIKVDPRADEAARAEAREKMVGVSQRLKQGEDFAALARELSECPSSDRGGDLGYFERGRMVQAFEDVAFSLNPGETSDIVETGFGYHIIRVTDKKAERVLPFEEVKDRIGQHLKQKKVQEEILAYIATLKEKADVKRYLSSEEPAEEKEE
jgi:peptidyl-prolyl cis-trans isomerase C